MASSRLVYFLPDSGNPFWREVVAGIEAKMGAVGMSLQTVSAGHDETVQASQLRECLQLRPEAVFISPVEMSAISAPCRAVRDAGIPVVALDQTMTGITTASVIAGNMKGGYMAAQHLASCLPSDKTIVHIRAERLPNVMLRNSSFVSEAGHQRLEVVKVIQADSSREKAFNGMREFLAERRRFAGVFAENDAMALGAIDALEQAGTSPWPVIIGFDGVPEALQAIRDGKMEATVAQNPRLLGEKAVEVLADIIAKRPFENTTSVLPTLVTRATVR